VRAVASLPRWPVVATVRPSPQSTFSLKTGVGERTAPSYTTSRTEFDPMSITPIGSSSCARPTSLSICMRLVTSDSWLNPHP